MKKLSKVSILVNCLLFLLLGLNYPVMAKEAFLNVAVSNTSPTLDPASWAMATSGLGQVYETLLKVKPGTSTIEPWLAESYNVSADGKTYTFRLRKGVKFHDGSTFNAEAVIFSFNRTKWYGGMGFDWLRVVNDVAVVDDYTVKFTLHSPSAIFLFALGQPNILYIVSPAAVKAHEKDGDWGKAWLDTQDAGTGPYIFKKTAKEDYVYLERFEEYWRGWKGKHLDKVMFKYVREASTRKMKLLNKEVDIAEDLLFQDVDELKKVPYLNVQIIPSNVVTLLRCRLAGGTNNALTNRKVREAIAYAMDYDQMIEVGMRGAARQAQGPLARGLFEHNDTLKVYRRDVGKAKELLKEAGYKEGEIKLFVMYNVGYDWKRLASEILMNNLDEVGIKVDLWATTWPGMQASLQDGVASPPPHLYWQYFSPIVDGFTVLQMIYDSKEIGDPKKGVIGWNMGYVNQEFDDLLAKAKVASDLRKYEELIRKAQEIWVKDFPDIPAWELTVVSSMSKKVKGYVPNPNWVADVNLYDMYLEE